MLFGRKRQEEELVDKIREIAERPVEMPVIEVKEPTTAPLFIKLDKYGQIINSMGELKNNIMRIKNAYSVLVELDRLREECINAIRNYVEYVDRKLGEIDSQLIRPVGFQEVPTEAVESLEGTLGELKNRLDQIKSQLQSIK
jgi:hypothetical protein